MIWLRRILLLALVLVVLAVGAVGIFLWTFDPNAYKDDVIAAAEGQLGRKLALNGEVQLSLYPWIGLTADGIEIGNPEGFGTGPMLKAGRIAVRAKLLPLWSGELQMDTVRLTDAEIAFIRLADGRDNWSGLGQTANDANAATTPSDATTAPVEAPSDAAPDTASGSPAPALASIVIGGVDIQGLKLHWDDAVSGQRFDLSEFAASTGALQLGAPVPFKASGRIDAKQPALNGSFNLESTLAYDDAGEQFELKPVRFRGEFTGPALPNGKGQIEAETSLAFNRVSRTLSIQGLQLVALDHQLTGELESVLPEGDDLPTFKAKLTGAGPDLASLFRALGLEPLASDLAKLKERDFKLDLEASADPSAGGFQLPVLNINILGAQLEAKASQQGELIQGSLKAAGPNLPALLATLSGAKLLSGPAQGAGQALKQYGAVPEFSLQTSFATSPKLDQLSLSGLKVQILGGKVLSQNLALAGLGGAQPTIKGDVLAEGSDVVAWLALVAATDAAKDDPLETNLPKLKALTDKAYSLKANVDVDTGKGRVDLQGLSARALGATLTGSLSTQGASYSGDLRLVSEQPKGLMTLIGNAELGQALQSFELNLPVSGDAEQVRVQPLKAKATVTGPDGKTVPLDLAVGLTAKPAEGDYALTDLKLTGLGMDIKGGANIAGLNADGARAVDGKLDVAPFNLRQVLLSLKQTLPEMADPKALTQVALNLAVSSAGKQTKLQGVRLGLDGATLTGDVAINDLTGPDLVFDIKGDRLDTTRYLAPKSQAVTPETAAAGATQLPLALLRQLKLDGRAHFDELVLSGLKLKAVDLVIKAKDGDIVAAPVQASLYEGSYNGAVGLNANGETARLSIDSTLSGIQIEPLLTDLHGKSRLKGRGDINLKVQATGGDSTTLTRTLTGPIKIKLNDGAIRGVNIGKLMRQLENGVFASVDSESTDFTELLATIDCQQGVCRNEDFSLKSPLVRLAGKGVVVDLPNDRIEYGIDANLVGTAAGQGGEDLAKLKGVTIPIKVTGSTGAPKYGIDFGGLVRKKAEDEARKLIGEKLGIELPGSQPAAAPEPAAPADGAAAPAEPAPAPAPQTPKEAVEQKAKEAVQEGLKKLLKF